MLLTLKISCILLLLGTIQFSETFPQFSIPLVSWNKNKEEPLKLTLKFNIQNPFTQSFGKNRQYEKSRRNNEVINNNEKIETLTVNPDANYNKFRSLAQTTQDPRIWGTYEETTLNRIHDIKENKPNVENRNSFKENEDKQVKLDFTDDDINKIFGNDDATTESTTEYETTTTEDFSDLYRSGVSSQVVATLLG